MPTLTIRSWRDGISSRFDVGTGRGSFKFGSNLDIRKENDTLSCGQALKEEGLFNTSHSQSPSISQSPSQSPSSSSSASPSPSNSPSKSASPSASPSPSASKSLSPSASASPSSSVSASLSPSAGLNNVYVDLVIAWVKATDGNLYGFGNAGNIYRRYPDGFTRNVYKDPDGAIKGAVEKPSDNGQTYLQWATDVKVKRKLLPGSSTWGDVETIAQNLTGTDWHTMKQIGGANYIANGSKLAYVGYDDSFTNEALNLVPGNLAKTILERNGRAVSGTYKTGYPNKGANGAIDCEYPLIQVGDDGDLYFANFTDSVPYKRFPGGGRVNPYGVANEMDQVEIFDWLFGADSWIDKQSLGNLSIWGVFGADSGRNGIYTIGRKDKEQPFSMNLEYAMDVDEIGAVVNVDGVDIASYRDGTDFGARSVDPDNKAEGTWEGLEFRFPIKNAEQITKVSKVEVFMDQLPLGCSVYFYYKKNKSDEWVLANTANGGDAFTATNGKKATFRIGAEMDIYEPKIVLRPSGNLTPEIFRVITYFE
jgi:hypothetical protein